MRLDDIFVFPSLFEQNHRLVWILTGSHRPATQRKEIPFHDSLTLSTFSGFRPLQICSEKPLSNSSG